VLGLLGLEGSGEAEHTINDDIVNAFGAITVEGTGDL